MGLKAMKVILLAGGYGTRLSEYTNTIPKPMVPIGGRPILWHIMNGYASFGHKEFCIAVGYKAEIIKEYFLNYRAVNSDFTIDLYSGALTPHQLDPIDWKVTLVNTGIDTMTGGRVKRMQDYIGDSTFLLSYGDGVANIDINDLIRFHKSHGKMVTITAVRPAARFGELEIDQNCVYSFKEKPQLNEGWINGGFFVIEPDFLNLINGDGSMLEREPLSLAVEMGELMAYRHHGFWHCMDNKRDHDLLESMWSKGSAPWMIS